MNFVEFLKLKLTPTSELEERIILEGRRIRGNFSKGQGLDNVIRSLETGTEVLDYDYPKATKDDLPRLRESREMIRKAYMKNVAELEKRKRSRFPSRRSQVSFREIKPLE